MYHLYTSLYSEMNLLSGYFRRENQFGAESLIEWYGF